MKWLTNMSKWEVRIFCCRFCRLSQPHRTSKDFFQNLWQTYFILTGLIPLHTAMCGESRGQAAPSKTVALTGGGGSGGGGHPTVQAGTSSLSLRNSTGAPAACWCLLLMTQLTQSNKGKAPRNYRLKSHSTDRCRCGTEPVRAPVILEWIPSWFKVHPLKMNLCGSGKHSCCTDFRKCSLYSKAVQSSEISFMLVLNIWQYGRWRMTK